MAVFLPLPGNEALAASLASLTGGTLGRVETRRFPDGESYLRLHAELSGQEALLVCTLDRPDAKLLPLLFAAATARRLGSPRVRLVAPYLAYMRQDAIFHPGEALASADFAALISARFDGIVTVDPHLHRVHSLSSLYACPATLVHAAPALARWIRENVRDPLVVGPDAESEQWAAGIAEAAGAPYLVFGKERLGDRQVQLSVPDLRGRQEREPVLVDDIVSSGTTLAAAADALREAGMRSPRCVVVHDLCRPQARRKLDGLTAGLISTNTVPGPTSRITVDALIARAL